MHNKQQRINKSYILLNIFYTVAQCSIISGTKTKGGSVIESFLLKENENDCFLLTMHHFN